MSSNNVVTPTTPAATPAATPAPAPAAVVAKAKVIQERPPIPEKPDPLLVAILRTRRAHGSTGDTNFRMWLLKHLEVSLKVKPKVSHEGCIIVQTDPKSDTLFSCHVDTVHGPAECDGTLQDLAYDAAFGHIVLAKVEQGQTPGCLGADDGAGVYVCLKMIEAKVPGTYIFHTGEERGGIGSNALKAKESEFLDQFSRAIAFDRAVQRESSPEVIITQGGHPCASPAFGMMLASALNNCGVVFSDPWVISHGGSFTDTKVYCGIIPECVNLGVFYAQQHSPREFLDVGGLEALVQAAIKIKWDSLKATRKPASPEVQRSQKQYAGGFGGYGFDDFDPPKGRKQDKQPASRVAHIPQFARPVEPEPDVEVTLESLAELSMDEMLEYVDQYPESAAAFLAVAALRLSIKDTEIQGLYRLLGAS